MNLPLAAMPTLRAALLATTALVVALPAHGQISTTGFGTLGYAVSDRPYAYQRFVDDSGTINRDSVLGLQMEARINDQFGFVVQGKLSPSIRNDSGWDPTLTWAFLSWRPTNDFLLRLGKFRIPYYLNSANLDVGVTYDQAQLSPELYSISTTNETNGISFSKNWGVFGGELTADAYWGIANSYWRFFFRDGVPTQGFPSQEPRFMPTRIATKGVALTYSENDNQFRVGFHQGDVSRRDNDLFTTNFRFNPVSPTQGYYAIDNASSLKTLRFNIITLGADIAFGDGFRLMAEYARRANVRAPKSGADTHGGYVSLHKAMGPWKPYVSLSAIRSTDASLDIYQALNGNRVTVPIPGLSLINASQRLNADRLVVYDQHTLAVGTSYLLSPTQKIKAEWAMTRVGKVSNFVDAPDGGNVSNTRIHVLSLSYNFTF